MTDLFGGRKGLLPWIEDVIRTAVLGKKNIFEPDEDDQQQQTGKLVQIKEVGDKRIDDVPVILLLHDGAVSIVAWLSKETRDTVRPVVGKLQPGYMIRIQRWKVIVKHDPTVEECPDDDVFERNAITREAETKTVVYLMINGGIVPLGGSALALDVRPIPALESVDVRRTLNAVLPSNRNLPIGNVPALFAPENRKNGSSAGILAEIIAKALSQPIPPHIRRDEPLPLGNVNVLFEAGSTILSQITDAVRQQDDTTLARTNTAAVAATAASRPSTQEAVTVTTNNNMAMRVEERNLVRNDVSTRRSEIQQQDLSTRTDATAATQESRTVDQNGPDSVQENAGVINEAITTQQHAKTNDVQPVGEETTAKKALQESEMVEDVQPVAEETTAKRSLQESEMVDQDSSDEDDEEDDLAIGNMLVDPSQTQNTPENRSVIEIQQEEQSRSSQDTPLKRKRGEETQLRNLEENPGESPPETQPLTARDKVNNAHVEENTENQNELSQRYSFEEINVNDTSVNNRPSPTIEGWDGESTQDSIQQPRQDGRMSMSQRIRHWLVAPAPELHTTGTEAIITTPARKRRRIQLGGDRIRAWLEKND